MLLRKRLTIATQVNEEFHPTRSGFNDSYIRNYWEMSKIIYAISNYANLLKAGILSKERTNSNVKKVKSSSRSQMFFKIGLIKISKFHRKTSVLEALFNDAAGLQASNFMKERLQHRWFLVKFAKFLKKVFLQNTSGGCLWYF